MAGEGGFTSLIVRLGNMLNSATNINLVGGDTLPTDQNAEHGPAVDHHPHEPGIEHHHDAPLLEHDPHALDDHHHDDGHFDDYEHHHH